ncbi:MAG: alpha/beta hydrolase fold domain-containing protein [Planctomycetota bacterium]|nr:alpha/beta hydrolase fold domain-containing protein [Planctomycetota bacterium]
MPTTTLVQDCFAYAHPNARTRRNVRYGPRLHHRLNYYSNIRRVPGGNPLAIVFHGGSYSANDKTDFIEGNSSSSLGRFWHSFLLDSSTYGTSRCFDVISAEYHCHAHERIHASAVSFAYEDTYASIPANVGTQNYPMYLGAAIDDAQRVVQWAKKHAAGLGIDPTKIGLLGHSMGGYTALCAAFTPSRAWKKSGGHEFDANADSSVRCVVVWAAEVDLDPWFMSHRITRYVPGFVESERTNVRADMERAFLIPDSKGLFPKGSVKTALCRSLSPVDLIRRKDPARAHVRVHAHYLDNMPFGSGESADLEKTTTPSEDYTTIPPYDAGGHDHRQFGVLRDACLDAGLTFSGQVLDGDQFTTGIITPPNRLKEALESTLVKTYDALNLATQ